MPEPSRPHEEAAAGPPPTHPLPPPAPPPARPLPAVGKYRLIDQVGAGGMGQVFRAVHADLGHTVAVKLVRPDYLGSPAAGRRFVREVRAAAAVDDPHVVRALDAGQAGGRYYLVTEFVDGDDLTAVVRRSGPLPAADVVRVAHGLARALAAVHRNGLVHRDVKPSNLMRVRATGAVKLLDLGLAKGGPADSSDDGGPAPPADRPPGPTSTRATDLTEHGTVVGTPDFMAPEQAANAAAADIRSDLYSGGCTLYYLLTGRVPFPGGTAIQKFVRHHEEPPPPVPDLRPDAPPGLVAVIARLMAKAPADRFQTPDELLAALAGLAPDGTWGDGRSAAGDVWQTVLAGARPAPRRPAPTAGRRAGWWLPAVAVAAAVPVVAVAVARRPPPRAPAPTDADRRAEAYATLAAQPGTAAAVRAAADLGRLPAAADGWPAVTGWSGRAGIPVARLAFADRDERLIVAPTPGRPTAVRLPPADAPLPPDAGDWADAAVAPDGSAAVGRRPDGQVVGWPAGRPVGLTADGPMAVGPGGRTVAAVADGRLWVTAAGGRPSAVAGLEGRPTAVAVAWDGNRVAVGTDRGLAAVYLAAGGDPIRRLQFDPPAVAHLTFAPDGRRLYAVAGEAVAAADVDGDDPPQPVTTSPAGPPTCLAVSADGRAVAVGTADGQAAVAPTAPPLARLAGVYGRPTDRPVREFGTLYFVDVLFAADPGPPASARPGLFPDRPAGEAKADGTPYALGTRFRAGVSGVATGVRFFPPAAEPGPNAARLWAADGTLLAEAAFPPGTGGRWRAVSFPTPVRLAAGHEYTAAVTVAGHYQSALPAEAPPPDTAVVLRPGGGVRAVAFSQDGRLLAAGRADGRVSIHRLTATR